TVKGTSGSASYTVTLTAQGGFDASVTLAAGGLPSGASAAFSVDPLSPTNTGSTSTMTVSTASSTPAGTYTITVTGTASNGTSHSATAALSVDGDYSISLTSTGLTVKRGSSVTDTVVLTTGDAYGSAVTLSLGGLPKKTRASLSPNPVIPAVSPGATATLTIDTSPRTAGGTYTVTITGQGADGTTHSTALTLMVQ
ncbi:MAG: glycoside hydrolase, partial [Chloroflexota bacterium]|nr:glycoside hydrolase [Chloroflexota bacterium]